MFPTVKPDLILLDVMLPGLDGTEVARRIRQTSNVPIIMLTAKTDTPDVVAGLEAGVDDYVPKALYSGRTVGAYPCLFPHRQAGGRRECGRRRENRKHHNHVEHGSIILDRVEHTVTKNGKDLNLTPMEFKLLFVLAAMAGEAISRSALLKNVWGYENSGDTRLVNVHIQRLRAKVEDDPENPQIVQTVRGIGYKFVTPED